MSKVSVFSGILVVFLVFSCVSAPETTVPQASAAPVAAAAPVPVPTPSTLDIIEKSIANGEFQEIEYKYILDMSRFKLGTSAAGKPTLPADLVGVLNYLGISFEAGTNPRREYYYLFAQAPNREFNDAGLIYRIREETGRDLARITLKFRMPDGATPEFPDSSEFEDFVNEFDAGASGAPTNDRASIKHTFSVAYDYEFDDPKGVRFAQYDGKIDFATSWNFLKAESPAIAAYIEKTVDTLYLDLYRKLWHLGLVNEVQSSKTNLYFSTFGK